MFDLNGEDFQEKEVKRIFNNGNGGKVNNVTISKVEKKQIGEAPAAPDYRIFFADEGGAEVNIGFWREAKDDTSAKRELGRLVHIARAVLGKDYVFPSIGSYTEGVDTLSKLIATNSSGKAFNLFVAYGNEGYPKKYLTIRYFDFIETADTPESESRLFVKKNDLLSPITEDAPVGSDGDVFSSGSESDLDDDSWV